MRRHSASRPGFLQQVRQANRWAGRYHATAFRTRAVARSPDALAATGVREPDGWTRAVLPIESVDLAIRGFLTPDIEVLEPPELRAQVAARARAIAALY